MEHLGTSAEVHLVASRMSWCSLQLSEHQDDNAPARSITDTVPLACHRTNPGLMSQDKSWEGAQIVMDSESNSHLQGLLPNANWTKLQLARARYEERKQARKYNKTGWLT